MQHATAVTISVITRHCSISHLPLQFQLQNIIYYEEMNTKGTYYLPSSRLGAATLIPVTADNTAANAKSPPTKIHQHITEGNMYKYFRASQAIN
jgi:hypothetical protein